MAVEYLEITQVLYFILEVLRGASILRVFLIQAEGNTWREIQMSHRGFLRSEYFTSIFDSCASRGTVTDFPLHEGKKEKDAEKMPGW